MQTTRQVNRILHDEHMHVQRQLDRLAAFMRQADAHCVPALQPEMHAFFTALAAVLADDLVRHFRFEEEELFPQLEANGEAEMTALLREDHELLLPLAAELRTGIDRLLNGTLATADWAGLRRLGLEFVERQADHIEKEEMALLPALEEALDEAQDLEIGSAYQAA